MHKGFYLLPPFEQEMALIAFNKQMPQSIRLRILTAFVCKYGIETIPPPPMPKPTPYNIAGVELDEGEYQEVLSVLKEDKVFSAISILKKKVEDVPNCINPGELKKFIIALKELQRDQADYLDDRTICGDHGVDSSISECRHST